MDKQQIISGISAIRYWTSLFKYLKDLTNFQLLEVGWEETGHKL